MIGLSQYVFFKLNYVEGFRLCNLGLGLSKRLNSAISSVALPD